jgi:hypothetical protein
MSLSLRRGRQVLRVRYPANLRATVRIDGTEHDVLDLSTEGLRVALDGTTVAERGRRFTASLRLLGEAPADVYQLEVLRVAPGGAAFRFVGDGVGFGSVLEECRLVLSGGRF